MPRSIPRSIMTVPTSQNAVPEPSRSDLPALRFAGWINPIQVADVGTEPLATDGRMPMPPTWVLRSRSIVTLSRRGLASLILILEISTTSNDTLVERNARK